ncbi:PREDICTED: osteopetrosis-associated transmembrane protein 1-like [Priapulus caudatus]|uniref:Osteopetrosis-associated transmembrane protein 1-like n=1 Tax=Priapulus caudatus TaxID=37621 RepID=A0ABM1F350_PRICU|nr:PREDICTED: osteopetrosis-associated transmembrane protein 1-like [Priapulus caudatus]
MGVFCCWILPAKRQHRVAFAVFLFYAVMSSSCYCDPVLSDNNLNNNNNLNNDIRTLSKTNDDAINFRKATSDHRDPPTVFRADGGALSLNADDLIAEGGALSTSNSAPPQNSSDSTPTAGGAPYEDEVAMSTIVVPLSDVMTPCEALLVAFSESTARFVRCSVLHSRPLKMCVKCERAFRELRLQYGVIRQTENATNTGRQCNDVLLHSDRIQVAETSYVFVAGLWSASNCEGECYNCTQDENSTQTCSKDGSVKGFYNRYTTLETCFRDHSNGGKPRRRAGGGERHGVHGCERAYNNLSRYFARLHGGDFGAVCMDLVDAI